MKNLFLVLLTLLLTSAFAQMPNTADSVYWTPKYCDTAESTFEAHLTQWTWNGNVGDCIQPSEAMANAFYNEKTGEVGLWLVDTYQYKSPSILNHLRQLMSNLHNQDHYI